LENQKRMGFRNHFVINEDQNENENENENEKRYQHGSLVGCQQTRAIDMI